MLCRGRKKERLFGVSCRGRRRAKSGWGGQAGGELSSLSRGESESTPSLPLNHFPSQPSTRASTSSYVIQQGVKGEEGGREAGREGHQLLFSKLIFCTRRRPFHVGVWCVWIRLTEATWWIISLCSAAASPHRLSPLLSSPPPPPAAVATSVSA